MENKVKNKIIALSGQPVTGKGTAVKTLIEKLKDKGYADENIHVISTGNEFRNYFNAISQFIKNFNDMSELEKLSDNEYLKVFVEKSEYRNALINAIVTLKKRQIDIANLTIEQANNMKEFSELRKVVDTLIDTKIKEKGEEINSTPRLDEIWIIDSRLAFHNIPDAFAVRLTSTPKVAGERLFNDKNRGEEDRHYASIEGAQQAREKRRIGEQKRYLKRYGVDLEKEDNYDLLIDTSYSSIEDISNTILTCFNCYVEDKPFSKNWISPKTLLPLQGERDTFGMGSYHESINETIDSIKEKGYLPHKAIEVIEVDGIKYIIEGHHRNFASAFLGKTLVPCKVIARDDEKLPGYAGTARERAECLKDVMLYGHEEIIETGQKGKNFSYNGIYPGIYEKIRSYTGEEH